MDVTDSEEHFLNMDGEGSFVIAMGERRGKFRGMSCELVMLLVDEEAGVGYDQEPQRELKRKSPLPLGQHCCRDERHTMTRWMHEGNIQQ